MYMNILCCYLILNSTLTHSIYLFSTFVLNLLSVPLTNAAFTQRGLTVLQQELVRQTRTMRYIFLGES